MIRRRSQTTQRLDEDNRDLGFGSKVLQQSHERFVNRDGSFNVSRTGFSFFRSLSVYHALLRMTWGTFFLLLIAFYFTTNLIFAFGYFLCGPGALAGSQAVSIGDRFLESFFFSVQTLATIGYGGLSPSGFAANFLVTIQALVGGLGFALATGLAFARFSRPNAEIVFSERAVIAPYKDLTAFEFRIVNARNTQLVEVHATVVLSRMEEHAGKLSRKFHELKLERSSVKLFPLHWVVVHPINDESPLSDVAQSQLAASDAEFIILLSGIDETSSQSVHVRSSYKYREVVWGAKFADMYLPSEGNIRVDLRKLDDVERVD
ncbi:MAG: ion channel [Ignavibacteriales bacterium]|nr:ion channel [Ignavibacteriales bacterium]